MSAIVVGTDGSEGARAAVLEAGRLAGALGQRVVVVSAYGTADTSGTVAGGAVAPDGLGRAEAVLRSAEADLAGSGVECDGRAVCGGAADAIVEVARIESAAMVVVGSRGMRGPRRILGSVPNQVSHRAPCSVLIVRTD